MLRKSITVTLIIFMLFLWMEWDVQKGKKANNVPLYVSPMYTGDFQIFSDGPSFYNSLLHDMENAKKYIHIHFFLIRSDDVSKSFLQALMNQAQRGIDVKLSADLLGGSYMTRDTIQKLKKSGVQFTYSRKIKLPHPFYTTHQRNHRRIAVIDGMISYTGGYNLGKEYVTQTKRFGTWKDYQVRIVGDGANEAENQFLRDWERDTGKKATTVKSETAKIGHTQYQYLFSSGNGLQEKIVEWIRSAKQSITIATPYYVPSQLLVQELENALKRNVHVTMIITSKTDAGFIQPTGYDSLELLYHKGAAIFQYQKGFFHGKLLILDDKMADIGTVNWDQRSLFINDESNCLIYDKAVISKIQEELQTDMKSSTRIDQSFFQNSPMWAKILKHTPKRIQYYY